CCGVLRSLKMHPSPAEMVQSNYFAQVDEAECTGCETCVERCQIEAIEVVDGISTIDLNRCIGCGLCVTTCSTESLLLVRKPVEDLPKVPKTLVDKYIRMGQARGKMKNTDLLSMMVKSKLDRLLAAMD
ncbi:MAG: 4Fe-4S binding protein, partial [Anaerolineales bacterium]|nr:4Fe-4S binding protein [Anaerolineales bacterium]